MLWFFNLVFCFFILIFGNVASFVALYDEYISNPQAIVLFKKGWYIECDDIDMIVCCVNMKLSPISSHIHICIQRVNISSTLGLCKYPYILVVCEMEFGFAKGEKAQHFYCIHKALLHIGITYTVVTGWEDIYS